MLKSYTLLAMSLAMATGAVASTAPAAGGLMPVVPKAAEVAAQCPVALEGATVRMKAPARALPAITQSQIQVGQPAGDVVNLSRSSQGYYQQMGLVYVGRDVGSVVTGVNDNNGHFWINNPVSMYVTNAWIRFDRSADGRTLTFTGAQKVYEDNFNGAVRSYYVLPMEYVITDTEQNQGWFYPTEDETLVLALQDDGSYLCTDNQRILGLCEFDGDEVSWLGYGDLLIKLEEHNDEMVQAPAGLKTDIWTVKHTNGGYRVEVGFDGDKVWMQGLMPSSPTAWVQGKVDGRRVTFDVEQYMGVNTNRHYSYLYGARVSKVWNDYYQQELDYIYAMRDIEFDYDADAKTFSGCTGLTSVPARMAEDITEDRIPYTQSIMEPSIKYIVRDPKAVPAAPRNISFVAYNDNDGVGSVTFDLLNEDVNGYVLATDKLFYNVFFNDKLFEFRRDEYNRIPQEVMTDVPYDYLDYLDFNAYNYEHTFYYYADGIDTIGIRSVYRSGDTVLYSPTVAFRTTDEPDSIDAIGTERIIESMNYYDLQGRLVAAPMAGSMYVVRTVYTDGTVETAKTIKR